MAFTDQDRKYLAQAINEAELDPRDFKVGAVIVTRDHKVVSAHGGEDPKQKEHAEHRVIDKCLGLGYSLDGAFLYTTLEPCLEPARSPNDTPCAVKILDNPITRVVIGLVDVDQRVRLKGIRKLRRKLEVVVCDDISLRRRIEGMMLAFLSRDRPQLLECPPFPLAKTFCGRHEERCKLTRWLCKRGEHGELPILVIHDGPGGTGKSTLAYVWMKRDVAGDELPLSADSSDEARRSRVDIGWRTGLSILWFSFYSNEGGGDFHRFLERAITHFSEETKRLDDYQHEGKLDYGLMAEEVITLIKSQPSLIIWDGAERLLREYERAHLSVRNDANQSRLCADPKVARFLWALCSSVHARLLILSRLPFADLEGRPAKQDRLKGLSPEAAIDFLKQRGVLGSDRDLRKRALDYKYHPLSLSNLAAAVTDDFATNGNIEEAPKFNAGVPMDRRRHHVLEVAYNRRAPHLQRLLSRLAATRGGISRELATLLSSDTDDVRDQAYISRDLRELVRHGLLNESDHSSGYELHPLVREYAYERLTNRTAIHNRLAQHYRVKRRRGGTSPVDRGWLNQAAQHFYHLARAGRYMDAHSFFYGWDSTGKNKLLWGRDLNQTLFFELGNYYEFSNLLSELFPDGTDHPPSIEDRHQPFVLNDLALASMSLGNLKLAKSLLERGFNIARHLAQKAQPYSALWVKHNEAMAICLESLGSIELRLGNLKGAEKELWRSIASYSNVELAAQRLEDAAIQRIMMSDPKEASSLMALSTGYRELFRRVLPYPFRTLSGVLLYCGACDEIKFHYAPITKILNAVGHKDYFYDFLWAQIALYENDVTLADQHLTVAEATFREVDSSLQYQRWRFLLKYLRAEISLGQRKLQNAEEEFGSALSESHLSNDLEHESRALLGLGRVTLERALLSAEESKFIELTAHARDIADRANELAERCAYALVLSEIHLFLAKLSLQLKDKETGRQHAVKAKTLASCGYKHPTHKSRYYRSVYQEAQLLLRGPLETDRGPISPKTAATERTTRK